MSRLGGGYEPRPIRRVGDAPSAPAPFEPGPERAVTPPPRPPRPPRGRDQGGRGGGYGVWIALFLGGLLAAAIVVLFVEPGLIELDQLRGSDADTEAEDRASAGAIAATLPISFEATLREELPPIPDVLGAVSPMLELRAPAGRVGPFEFTIRLSTPTQDARNLGAYTWDGENWVRLGLAQLTSDGVAARITLTSAPANIAILRRLQFRDVIAGRVPRGEEPQADVAGSLTVVHPDGWTPGADGSLLGGVNLVAPSITQSVWPTLYADEDHAEIVNDILASDTLRQQHIRNIQFSIQNGHYDGIDIHYLHVSPALRSQFTSFITELADLLHLDDRGLAVHIPITASGGFGEGAYDLALLGAAADFIVIEPPLDPTVYEAAIAASLPTLLERVERERILLALRSNAMIRTSDGFSEISQREALGIASKLSIREPGPFRPGARVTLQGESVMLDNASSGLRWDQVNHVVTFSYADPAGSAVTIWIENRFSAAFRLQVVEEWQLGGVYLSNASADPGNANLWPALAAFFESGRADLRLPNPILFAPVFSVEAGTLSGASGTGWQLWELPGSPGAYEAQLVVSDGDVRVGHVITVPVEAAE